MYLKMPMHCIYKTKTATASYIATFLEMLKEKNFSFLS